MKTEKTARIDIRVTEKDKQSIKEAGLEMGLNITEYIRWLHMWNIRVSQNAKQNTAHLAPLGD